MIAVSKNVYNDKLDGIVNECNNKHHRKIKMKPTAVKNNTYIDYINNDKYLSMLRIERVNDFFYPRVLLICFL